MRLIIFITLFIIFSLATFFAFGESIEIWFQSEQGLEWIQKQGHLAGIYGVLLLVSDILLPIPGTTIMAILGQIYGPVVGGIYSVIGNILAGFCTYALVRIMGDRVAIFIAGENVTRLRIFFDRGGMWAIALTRILPIIPEVLCTLAGLAKMRMSFFITALLCGSIPQAFIFSTLGAWGKERPFFTLLLATTIPIVLLIPTYSLIKKNS
ncbi:TVP38/TMEM64 family protein [Candidatus Uabimicrobium sp. HlEnr_7]|uniref:TVP38/TMEM64 family protein n=1 Tax=Candidatus Uabimicrobium helgolandensis TaxID=3095367 RepID=UPI003557F3D2